MNLIPFVLAASFMTWNAWLMWRWEGLLVERGTLPRRRFLVRRGSESYRWPLALLPPGVLSSFDLPDCYRALESKRLRQIEPVGADS